MGRSPCLATWSWHRPPKQTATPSNLPRWSLAEKLGYEKDLLGFYVTGHPLDPYREIIEGGKYVAVSDLANQEDKVTVQCRRLDLHLRQETYAQGWEAIRDPDH